MDMIDKDKQKYLELLKDTVSETLKDQDKKVEYLAEEDIKPVKKIEKSRTESFDYKGWNISINQTDKGWDGHAKQKTHTLSIRKIFSDKKELVAILQQMVDNYIYSYKRET